MTNPWHIAQMNVGTADLARVDLQQRRVGLEFRLRKRPHLNRGAGRHERRTNLRQV